MGAAIAVFLMDADIPPAGLGGRFSFAILRVVTYGMSSTMWVWSKRSAAGQEDLWEDRFQGNQNAVITILDDRTLLRVDLYCELERDALEMARCYGGTVRGLEEVDWVAESARAGPPLKIRDQLLVTSETDPAKLRALREHSRDRTLVSIPAEMAFGTGDHATTSSCLRFLVDEALGRQAQYWSMLDIGCGTGVLAVGANLLGAGKVEAMDFDPVAVSVARRNVERNSAAGVEVLHADLDKWTPENMYDVIVANLFSAVLQRSFGKMAAALKEDASLIISGVLEDQWDDTHKAAQSAGLTFDVVHRKGKWVAAKGRLA